jgi:hypothetical protein
MSLEADDSSEQEPRVQTGRDEDANAEAQKAKGVNESPFTTPETEGEFRSFLGSRFTTASVTPFDEQDEPETPSEPPPDDSPFSTPEVEEITKGAPPTPDDRD